MQRSTGAKWIVALAMSAAMACAASAQKSKPVDDKALKGAAKSDEWLSNGHDLGDNRYSPLKQIDTTNAGRLGLAWSYDTAGTFGTVETTPIVWDGILYGTAPWSIVYALDAKTGKEIWRWDPKISHQNFPVGSLGKADKVRTGPSVCCGPANRGVALYDGKIYVGTLEAKLVALDAKTGKELWSVQAADEGADYSITGAPIIAGGKVIIGNAGGEYSARGFVSAFDAQTGKLDWRFYTVPGNPAKPFENKAMEVAAKTWTGEWWKLGGGGTVWDGISYDPDLDLLYIGTSQGGPWVGKYRSPQGGANLYVCSIVALKPETGEYVWHFQTTPGDEWDYDATQGITLADIKIDGKMRKVLMQAPKNGFFYVLDRKTGEFISGKPYVHVTWATGLDPKTGKPNEAPDMRYDSGERVVSPGPAGGHAWQGMSYDPNTGLVYLPALDSDFHYIASDDFKPEVGVYSWGIVFRPPPPPAGQTGGGQLPIPPGGSLVAWDPATQTERWRLKGMNGSGTVATAGGVVFGASDDGNFKAFNAVDGKELWSVKLAAGMANPATYMIDGKQYVSILAGRGGHGRMYTFALDAKEPMPNAPPAGTGFGPPPPPPPAPGAGPHSDAPVQN
jgi:PQQ-dependent dehydrogenase (methanol/ethanol family)